MEATSSDDASATPLFKKRGPKKSTMRKRAATPPPTGSDSDYSSTDDGGSGARIKRRKRTGGLVAASNGAGRAADHSTTKYAAEHTARVHAPDGAAIQPSARLASDAAAAAAASATQAKPKEAGPAGDRSARGPVKAAANVRTVTVTDYSPDVCKDYKQTGFCGFGDSCKFLHAREDYKQGWQLDREWETVTQGKKGLGGTVVSRRGAGAEAIDGDDSDAELAAQLDGIPFACILCRGPYKDPIVTKCGHYFCESCALRRFRKTPSCAACGAGTGGVFNGAKNLRKLLDKKRERAAKRREKAREAGEEVSDDEEEEALPEVHG